MLFYKFGDPEPPAPKEHRPLWRQTLERFLASFIVFVFLWLSGLLYQSRADVDFNSGAIRHRSYLFGVKVWDRVEPTWMSEALERDRDLPAPLWQKVSREFFPPKPPQRLFIVCDRNRFRGMNRRLNDAASLFTEYEIPEERKTELANQLLEAWSLRSFDDPVETLEKECLEGIYPENEKSKERKPV